MTYRINPFRIAIMLVALFMGFGHKVFAQCKDWVRLGGVTSDVSIMYPQPIAVDGSGVPYIVIEEPTTNKATVKKYNGTSWVVVGTNGFSPGSILGEDIKVDNSGTPYVVFLDGSADWKVTVMKYNGASWVTVGSAGFTNPVLDVSLAIDASGTPYVGFIDNSDSSKVTVMKFNGSSWTPVGSTNFSTANASHVSIAVDNTAGTPYVAFGDGAHSGGLTVMKYNGSSWTIVGAANISGANASAPSIAVSSAGVPYVGYGSYDGSYGLFVKSFDGAGWNAVGGEILTGVADFCTVALDASGALYVGCLSENYSTRPSVLKFNGSSWDLMGSIDLRYMAYKPSFAVTGAGTPYMSYGNTLFTNEGIVARYETVSTTISGSPTVCIGATTALTHAQGGGIWSSGGSNIATVGSGTGIVSGVAGGGVNLSYTVGSCSAIKIMTVSPNQGTISGPRVVNAGSTISLSNIATGGTWSVSNANTSINSSGVLTGVTFGTTTVSYTVTGSCGTAVDQLVVDVLPAGGTGCRDWVTAGDTIMTIPSSDAYLFDYQVKMAPDGTAYACFTTLDPISWEQSVAVKRFNGSNWVNVGGESIPYVPGALNGPADMTIDNSGNVYVSADGEDKWVVCKFNGYYWQPLPVLPVTHAQNVRIVTDATGALYAAFVAAPTFRVTVMKYNGASWETVGVPGFSAGQCWDVRIAISGATPYVSYSNILNDNKLDVMKYNGSSWEFVGSPGVTAPSPWVNTIAVSSDGTPYLFDGTVRKFNGTSWEHLASFSPDFHTNDMIIDESDVVYVFGSGPSYKGIVQRYTGGTWQNFGSTAFTPSDIIPNCLAVHNGDAFVLYSPGYSVVNAMRYGVKASNLAPITGPTTLCTGSTISLAESVTGGSWSSNNTDVAVVGSATGVVTGVAGGTATISYSIGSSCVQTYEVSNGSTAGIITGPLSVQAGHTATFTDAIAGGTWSVSNGNASISASGVLTGISAGTVTVSYATGACGSYVATAVVNVYTTAGSCSAWETVGLTGYSDWQVSYLSSAVDAWGRPYVIFDDITNGGRPLVKRYDGNAWVQVGAGALEAEGPTKLNAIAIDKSGMPYVAYIDYAVGAIRVEKFNGSSWSRIGSIDNSAFTLDMAFDTSGALYVAYRDGGSSSPAVLRYNGVNWAELGSIPGPMESFTTGVKLAIHGSTPYIVTSDENPSLSPAVWKFDGTDWEVVGSAGFAGGTSGGKDPDIAINSIGMPYVICADNSNGDKAVVMKFDGSSWVAAGGILSTDTAQDMSIVIDKDDNVLVTYFQNGSTPVMAVKKYDGSSWSNVGPVSVTEEGRWATLAVDPAGVPYLSFSGIAHAEGRIETIRYYASSSITISGTATVCNGGTTSLSSSSTGGTWSSSDAAIASVGSSNGVVTGVSNGTAVISYTLGSCSASVIVTVSPSGGSADVITGTLSVCMSAATTLANATPGGTWTSSNVSVATVGSTSGIVSGAGVGNAMVTYVVNSSCGTSISTAMVTVNAVPSAGVIAGAAMVCESATTTLSNATTGGTWSGSDASIASVGSASGIVSGVASGTATITYIVTSACGSATTTKVITVNSTPTAGAISGTASVCVGGSSTLTNATTGGTWTSSNTSVASINLITGVVTGVASGTATITYAVSGSCGSAMATKTVTVGTTASITGALSLCAGMTSSLSGGVSGGTWSSSNTAVATVGATTGVLTAVATGTANITYSSGTGCMATAVAAVSMPAYIAGTATACVGQTSVLSNATPGGTWTSSNTALATVDESTGVVTGIAAGTATISYLVSAGCYRTSSFIVKALPPAVATPVTVCVGSTVNIPPPSSNGLSWTSSNTSVATIGSSSGVLTGISAGTTTLTYTTNTGCFITTVATVNVAPAITGTTSLCTGSVTTLSSAIAGGVWSSSSASVASVSSTTGVVTGGVTGTATITYNAPGCSTATVVSVSALAAIAGSPNLCLGASAALSDATPGGTWSSSNSGIASVGTSGIVTGVSAGTATITYTIAAGCTRTITVTVSAASGAISGTLTVCPGFITSLSAATSGGAWSGGNASIATINSSTGVVTGIGAGTINVSYTLAGCRATAIATVNPLPAVIAGTLSACVTQAAMLTDATIGGTWISNNTAVATIDPLTGEATGVSAGTTTMTYALGTGCNSTATFTVKALPPAVAIPIAACVGTTTSIAPPSTNGKSWTSSNTDVATIGSGSGILTGVSTGTTILTYTTNTGCFVTTEATVYPTPATGTITGPSTVILGNTITLDNAAGGGVWSSSNTARASIGSATGVVTGVGGGTATISYSVSNPGCTVRATKVISVTNSRPGGSIVSADNNMFRLYPNPTTGAFTIEVEEAGTFSVYTLDGREVSSSNISTGFNQLTLSKELASGIYMCRFTSESGNTTIVRLVYER